MIFSRFYFLFALACWFFGLVASMIDARFGEFSYQYYDGVKKRMGLGFPASQHSAATWGDPLLLIIATFVMSWQYRTWPTEAWWSLIPGFIFSWQFHWSKPKRIQVPGHWYDPAVKGDPERKGGLRLATISHVPLMALTASTFIMFYGWTSKKLVQLPDGHFVLLGVPHWQLLVITGLLTIFIPTCIVMPDRRYYRDGKARKGAKLTLLLIPYLWYLCWYMW